MFTFLANLASIATPLFLILSPILSYSDQAYSMHRAKSSKGFSLDIPLIMLVASFLRVFYYPGARFDTALLIQSFVMIVIQLVLLKIALENRAPVGGKGGDVATPFASVGDGGGFFTRARPWGFWQWRSSRPYWQFLLYLFILLTSLELLLAPFDTTLYPAYSSTIGYIGLSVEATLPLPQISANHRSRSCRGFRISVLANWLAGDAMKMFWFFTATSEIPWAFKLCGIFQACCDCFLGVQYWMYGEGGAGAGIGGLGGLDGVGMGKIGNGVAATPYGGSSEKWKQRGHVGGGMGMDGGLYPARRSATPVGEKGM